MQKWEGEKWSIRYSIRGKHLSKGHKLHHTEGYILIENDQISRNPNW